MKDSQLMESLFDALTDDDVSTFRTLIPRISDINCYLEHRQKLFPEDLYLSDSVIDVVCSFGAGNCFFYLLSIGFNLSSNYYQHPIRCAAAGGNLRIFRIIYERRKATLANEERCSIEVASCRCHALSIVKFFCLVGWTLAPLQTATMWKTTPLGWAAFNNCTQILRVLVEHGAVALAKSKGRSTVRARAAHSSRCYSCSRSQGLVGQISPIASVRALVDPMPLPPTF
jgi:hypothetical protein